MDERGPLDHPALADAMSLTDDLDLMNLPVTYASIEDDVDATRGAGMVSWTQIDLICMAVDFLTAHHEIDVARVSLHQSEPGEIQALTGDYPIGNISFRDRIAHVHIKLEPSTFLAAMTNIAVDARRISVAVEVPSIPGDFLPVIKYRIRIAV